MEIWDLYDKNRHPLGKTKIRGEKFDKDDYHIVVHVCIFNSKNEMLIQQRQPFKKGWPGLWDVTIGGSALQGEDSSACAKREIFEEIGLEMDFENKRPFLTVHFAFGFDDYYIIEEDVNLDTLKLQPEEVAAVKWADKETIIKLIDNTMFVPYHKNLIGLLYDLKDQRGAHYK
ncbi:MAG TPA: NUDIX domain-containing protein [Clostridia bacterium]|jgi:isopentenyldiphosphate isomerase|nr:MAG: Isopentenyl-diphosphate Delta-isomerase [Firmicutes bacterium ADurb.Bin146]HOD92330.1 NUDIX domain-containing protein [Clostridia bacterium]HQM38673.1 NUDIX domain-containing protein [Clostridia bacterium]